MYSINQSYIHWFAFVFKKPKLHSNTVHETYTAAEWNREICIDIIKESVTFCFRCVICVYFCSVLIHACTFNKVIYFCVKKFPLCIYHYRERVSSGMTVSSFCFLDTQRLILWNVVMEKVSYSKRCVHLGYQMSSNLTVKWVWIFFACVQESPFHGFPNSSFNYLCSDSSFQ